MPDAGDANVRLACRRTVHDKQTGRDIVLSDEQVELVKRLQRGQFGDVNFDEFQVRRRRLSSPPPFDRPPPFGFASLTRALVSLQPSVDFFTKDVMIHPVTNRPADKRSFIPSLIEKDKVIPTSARRRVRRHDGTAPPLSAFRSPSWSTP